MNLPMEILASLPRFPRYVRLRDLADDLGLPTQTPISAALEVLKSQGFQVESQNATGGRIAAIRPQGWRKAQRMAERYWRQTYEKAAT